LEQNIGAQVQLHPMKIQCLLPATPKSQPPIRNKNAASSAFSQHESKLNTAPHKENDSSKSEAMEMLPLNVAQMEMAPFKAAKPEACTVQTDPVVAKVEAVCAFCFLCSVSLQ
jgi:hypothetical protein